MDGARNNRYITHIISIKGNKMSMTKGKPLSRMVRMEQPSKDTIDLVINGETFAVNKSKYMNAKNVLGDHRLSVSSDGEVLMTRGMPRRGRQFWLAGDDSVGDYKFLGKTTKPKDWKKATQSFKI